MAKKYDAVQIRWMERFGITTKQFDRLERLLIQNAAADTDAHNVNAQWAKDEAAKAGHRLQQFAEQCGFTVRWSDGLYPALLKNGEESIEFPFH